LSGYDRCEQTKHQPTPTSAKLAPLPRPQQLDVCMLLVRPSTRSMARSLRTHHSTRSPA